MQEKAWVSRGPGTWRRQLASAAVAAEHMARGGAPQLSHPGLGALAALASWPQVSCSSNLAEEGMIAFL